MHTLKQLRAGELIGITALTLYEGLTEFPPEILSLADSLEYLDLSNNQLSALPDTFAELVNLKIVFLSNNLFTQLPEVLGRCLALEMIGFKANKIVSVPANALPPATRWLILTDNQITQLPDSIGDCVHLQKCMLAGNRLTELPASLSRCQHLQLLRISANRLVEFPRVLFTLPKLAWLAFAGNPFCGSRSGAANYSVPQIARDNIALHEVLGQGASGVIYRASCKVSGLPKTLAVKIFKGEVTSDGYPQDELNACLKINAHPNLVTPLAYVDDDKGRALIMALIPEGYRNLGQPPSLASCTRDTFAAELCVTLENIQQWSKQLQSVLVALHQQGFCHGDIYAHNLLNNADGHVLFSDFGAASDMSGLSDAEQSALIKIEYRALGFFIADLLTIHRPAETKQQQLLLAQLQLQSTKWIKALEPQA